MTPSSHAFTADAALARRLEQTDARVGLESARMHAHLHPESGAATEPFAGGHAIFTGVGSPFTQALGLGMAGVVTESEMERMEEFFFNRGSAAFVELCPLADASLLQLLGLRDYRLRDCTNMLVKQLGTKDGPAGQSEIRVEPCSVDQAEVWARTVLQGFAEEEGLSPANLEMLLSLFHMPEAACMLAWVGDVPVGGGALSIHEGIAAFYGASTLPAYRRRGAQQSIIRAMVGYARNAGCELAYTLTQPGSVSQRNLERQNFRIVYTRVLMVRTPPDR